MMHVWPEEFSSEGIHVRLEPLKCSHENDLITVIEKSQLHKLWFATIPAPSNVAMEIERRQHLRNVGSMLPFAVIDKNTQKAVGMTTYMNIDSTAPRLEIGSTWICPSVQKTSLNTECKLLLLSHAFEKLSCIAVEFRTHYLNHQSKRAIERLGAKLDGVLRSHAVMENGTIRDTAVYSILSTEWPTVKVNLEWMLQKYHS